MRNVSERTVLFRIMKGQFKQLFSVKRAVCQQNILTECFAQFAAARTAGLHHLPRNLVTVEHRHTVRAENAERFGLRCRCAAEPDYLHRVKISFHSASGNAPARISAGLPSASEMIVEGVPSAVFPPSRMASISP